MAPGHPLRHLLAERGQAVRVYAADGAGGRALEAAVRAGGVAAVGGPVDEGYLVLALGLEGRPGGPDGWFVEAGVGGGARLAAGWRWRQWPVSGR